MKKLLTAAICAASFAAPASAKTFNDTFTSYVAFGDSLSDSGKIPLPLPYSTNPETGGSRFSNGPVWTEFLAQRFLDRGLATQNLALGGATAGEMNIRTNGVDEPENGDPEFPLILQPLATFSGQIASFAPQALSPFLQGNPLVSVFLGGNDFLQGESPVIAANAVADGIVAINGLADKFDDFLVSNLPDLAPPVPGDPPSFASVFNETLGARLDDIAADGLINIVRINQNEFQLGLFAEFGELGIDPLLGPCLDEIAGTDCSIIGVDDEGEFIRDLELVNRRNLIDSVHPTAQIQRAFGTFAIEALGDRVPAPVPLPAGLPLLIGGLAAVGLLRTRRRQA